MFNYTIENYNFKLTFEKLYKEVNQKYTTQDFSPKSPEFKILQDIETYKSEMNLQDYNIGLLSKKIKKPYKTMVVLKIEKHNDNSVITLVETSQPVSKDCFSIYLGRLMAIKNLLNYRVKYMNNSKVKALTIEFLYNFIYSQLR